jgi:hypothetical protein
MCAWDTWKRVNIVRNSEYCFYMTILSREILENMDFVSIRQPVKMIDSCRSYCANLSLVPFHQPAYCASYRKGNVINYKTEKADETLSCVCRTIIAVEKTEY